MSIKLKGLNFLLTYGCPARCAHCSYRGGQVRGGSHLRAVDVAAWLRLVCEHPLEWVMFLGGEPFIYLDELILMVDAVRCESDAEPKVSTNGYWAYEENVARARLARLHAAGLDHIRFSVDAFHSGFVPVGRVALGIRAARAVGYKTIAVDVQWVLAPDANLPTNAATRRMLDALAGMVDMEGVEIVNARTHPVGRAAERLPELLQRAGKMPVGLCAAEGMCVSPYTLGEDLRAPYAVEIHPDGTVSLCPGIALGSARQTPLDVLLEAYDYKNYPMIRILVERGPVGLLEAAEALGYVRRTGYVDACHLCYEARAFLASHEPNLGPPHIYDRAR